MHSCSLSQATHLVSKPSCRSYPLTLEGCVLQGRPNAPFQIHHLLEQCLHLPNPDPGRLQLPSQIHHLLFHSPHCCCSRRRHSGRTERAYSKEHALLLQNSLLLLDLAHLPPTFIPTPLHSLLPLRCSQPSHVLLLLRFLLRAALSNPPPYQ